MGSEALMLFALVFSVRSLMIGAKRQGWGKFRATVAASLWGAWTLLLIWVLPFRWPSEMSLLQQGMLLVSVGIALWVLLDPRARQGRSSWNRTLFGVLQGCFAALLCGWNAFGAHTLEEPLLALELKGSQRPQEIDFQIPGHPPQHMTVPMYRVMVHIRDGQIPCEVWGDVLSVRSRHLRLSPWLQFLGFGPMLWADGIRSEMLDPRHAEQFPAQFIALPLPQSLATPAWLGWMMNVWQETFLSLHKSWWVDVAQVESAGISLVASDGSPHHGMYQVWVTPSGLVIRADSPK